LGSGFRLPAGFKRSRAIVGRFCSEVIGNFQAAVHAARASCLQEPDDR